MKKITVRLKKEPEEPEKQQIQPADVAPEPETAPAPVQPVAEKLEEPFLMPITDTYMVEKAIKGVVRYGSINVGDTVAVINEHKQVYKANVKKVHNSSGSTSVWLDIGCSSDFIHGLLCKPVPESAADVAKLFETEKAERKKLQKHEFYMCDLHTVIFDGEHGIRGTVMRGEICVGDEVELIGTGSELPCRGIVTAIKYAKNRDCAQKGDTVCIGLDGISEISMMNGSILYSPDSLTIFGGYVILDENSDGIYKNYRPKAFRFDGQPIGGVVTMITTSDWLDADDDEEDDENDYFGTDDCNDDEDDDDENYDFDDEDEEIPIIVVLDRKLDIDVGDDFTIHDHGEIGTGIIMKIIE